MKNVSADILWGCSLYCDLFYNVTKHDTRFILMQTLSSGRLQEQIVIHFVDCNGFFFRHVCL